MLAAVEVVGGADLRMDSGPPTLHEVCYLTLFVWCGAAPEVPLQAWKALAGLVGRLHKAPSACTQRLYPAPAAAAWLCPSRSPIAARLLLHYLSRCDAALLSLSLSNSPSCLSLHSVYHHHNHHSLLSRSPPSAPLASAASQEICPASHHSLLRPSRHFAPFAVLAATSPLATYATPLLVANPTAQFACTLSLALATARSQACPTNKFGISRTCQTNIALATDVIRPSGPLFPLSSSLRSVSDTPTHIRRYPYFDNPLHGVVYLASSTTRRQSETCIKTVHQSHIYRRDA